LHEDTFFYAPPFFQYLLFPSPNRKAVAFLHSFGWLGCGDGEKETLFDLSAPYLPIACLNSTEKSEAGKNARTQSEASPAEYEDFQ